MHKVCINNCSNINASDAEATPSKIQGMPRFLKTIGAHWKALADRSQMSTLVLGFQSFFCILLYWPKLATSRVRVNTVYSVSSREGADVSEQLVVYRMQECHVLCVLDRELAERVVCDHQGNAVYSISPRGGSDVSEQLVVYRMQESHVLCSLDRELAERVVCDHQGNAVYSISSRGGSDVSEQLVVYRMQECHVLRSLDRSLLRE